MEENQNFNETIEMPKPDSTPTVIKGSYFY